MHQNFHSGASKLFVIVYTCNVFIKMESTPSQPLLQENSESEAEHFGEGDIGARNDSITENLDKELLRSGQNAPQDKYSFNYIIFYLMGMTTLLPWNFFITAEDVSYHSYSFYIL